jgi:hypothetical protein
MGMLHGEQDLLLWVVKLMGRGGPVKLAHLLGKDSYDILEKTVNPDLRQGLNLLQASSLLVVGFGKALEKSRNVSLYQGRHL